jgi:hypothetical protein
MPILGKLPLHRQNPRLLALEKRLDMPPAA